MTKYNFFKTTNQKLILLMMLVVLVFITIIFFIYNTFPKIEIAQKEIAKTVSSSSISENLKKPTQFENDKLTNSDLKINCNNNCELSSVETKNSNTFSITKQENSSSQQQLVLSDIPESNGYQEIIPRVGNDKQTYPKINIETRNELSKIQLKKNNNINFKFDFKDIENISKYTNISFDKINSNIISKIFTSTQSEVIVLKVPTQNIFRQVGLDFPSTFRLSNEDRLPIANDRIILYYPQEKRAAYLGEFITDVYDFKYQDQNYWLSVYYGDLIISKPDFKDWKFVTVGEYKIDQIVKKSDFEFEVITKYTYEDFDEYKKEVISPQKYIIDGLFNQNLD
jgi:hypothetical protein